jgi:hypothetical protein
MGFFNGLAQTKMGGFYLISANFRVRHTLIPLRGNQ